MVGGSYHIVKTSGRAPSESAAVQIKSYRVGVDHHGWCGEQLVALAVGVIVVVVVVLAVLLVALVAALMGMLVVAASFKSRC